MNATPIQRKPPFSLRVVIFLLGTLLMLLLIWLLGFFLRDIARIPGPDFDALKKQYVDAALLQQAAESETAIEKINQQLNRQQEIRQNAQQSMESARATIDKMVDLHRLSLEKGVSPSAEQQTALAESQKRFLETQSQVGQADAETARLAGDRFDLQQKLNDQNARLAEQRKPAEAAFAMRMREHSFKVAALQLALIVPIFLLAGWMVHRLRRSPYRPVFMAALAASFWEIGVVMHRHFPSEYFKYIAIVAAIAVTLVFLVRLLTIAVRPRLNDLLKRYREGYNRQRCPVCAYPIRRGPHRHAVWDGKGPRLARGSGEGAATEGPEEPYNCPSCGTKLYEPCVHCGKTRHSLLPYCDACGAEHPLPGLDENPKSPAVA